MILLSPFPFTARGGEFTAMGAECTARRGELHSQKRDFTVRGGEITAMGGGSPIPPFPHSPFRTPTDILGLPPLS